MTQRVVTQQELQDTLAFWRRHEDSLQDNHKVSEGALYWLRLYTKSSSIGYDFSQIRPGKLGQWDIFEMLVECLSFEDRLLISGLSAEEVARTELDDAYGFNPEDPSTSKIALESSIWRRLRPFNSTPKFLSSKARFHDSASILERCSLHHRTTHTRAVIFYTELK